MAKLSRSHGKSIEDPSSTEISAALADIEDDNGSFVILETPLGFIQTTLGIDGGLIVEYKSEGKHLQSVRSDYSAAEVSEMIDKFVRNDLEPLADHRWTELAASSGCLSVLFGTATLLGLLLAI